jgi:hypothetical protein
MHARRGVVLAGFTVVEPRLPCRVEEEDGKLTAAWFCQTAGNGVTARLAPRLTGAFRRDLLREGAVYRDCARPSQLQQLGESQPAFWVAALTQLVGRQIGFAHRIFPRLYFNGDP